MGQNNSLQDLLRCFAESPEPSFKVTNYFKIYAELFGHLRGTDCTFIETGVLNGGSLFMWRKWLGNKARIIGIDLNPEAEKWTNAGFEIYIGDQGNPKFWQDTFKKVGTFDVLLDDGGHQSFQQIVTLIEGLRAAKSQCIIAVEDTCTSFFKEFSNHGKNSFLEYAKDSTDILISKCSHFFENQFPEITNQKIVNLFTLVHSVQFFCGMVAYKIDPLSSTPPGLIWNRQPNESAVSDFRYEGATSAEVDWPNLFSNDVIKVMGGKS